MDEKQPRQRIAGLHSPIEMSTHGVYVMCEDNVGILGGIVQHAIIVSTCYLGVLHPDEDKNWGSAATRRVEYRC